MTLVRDRFAHVPTAVTVNPDRAEELFVIDSWFEDITGPALVISDEDNARSQVTLQNVACVGVPLLALFRQSGVEIQGMSVRYRVTSFTSGLRIDDVGEPPDVGADVGLGLLEPTAAPVPSDIPALPPCETWVNVLALGVKGDGVTDDTQALREAIAAHRTLYFPTGRYRVTDTLTLRPDTVLVGLSPVATQIVVPDDTPAFQGAVALRKPPEAPPWLASMMGGPRKPGDPPRRVLRRWLFGPPPAIEGPEAASGGAAWRHEHRHRHRARPRRHEWLCGGGQVVRRVGLDDERRTFHGRARDGRAGWHAHQSLQRQPHRRCRSEPRLGLAVLEPLGHRRGWGHLQGHLDAQPHGARGPLCLGHRDPGAHLRDVGRAPRAQRGHLSQRGELAHLRAAARGGER